MEHRERLLAVAVEARRLGGDHEDQLAAGAGLVLGRGGPRGGEGQRAEKIKETNRIWVGVKFHLPRR